MKKASKIISMDTHPKLAGSTLMMRKDGTLYSELDGMKRDLTLSESATFVRDALFADENASWEIDSAERWFDMIAAVTKA